MTKSRKPAASKPANPRSRKPAKASAKPGPWGQVWLHFQDRNVTAMLSPRTVQFYAWGAKPFAEYLDRLGVAVADVSAADVRGYVAEQQARGRIIKGHFIGTRSRRKDAPRRKRTADKRRELAKRTVHAFYRGASALLSFAVAEGLLVKVPIFKLPRLPSDEPYRVIGDDKWSKIWEAVAEGALPERDAALLHVILSSGMRRAEVAALLWEQVAFDDGRKVASITVKNGKGDKDRRTVLTGEGFSALRVWQAHLKTTLLDWAGDGASIPWVFPSVSHAKSLAWAKWHSGGRKGPEPERNALGPIEGDSIGMLFCRLSKRVGFRLTCHSLRHVAAREWQRRGVSIGVIQQLLGHASLVTTARYTTLGSEEAQAAALDILAG